MRLLPTSLFGRLALILFTGVLLTQLLSTLLQFHDRGQRLFQASGLQSAERIAAIVRLLDGQDLAARKKLVSVINIPPFKVSLSDPIWSKMPMAMSGSPRAKFKSRLHSKLGKRFRMQVAVSDQPTMNSMHSNIMGDRTRMSMKPMGVSQPEGLIFLAQVQLSDGSWVTFENEINHEVFSNSTMLIVNIALIIIIVMMITLLAVRLVTKPLTLLATQANKLGNDINQPPLVESGPTEMRKASRAFNTMQCRIQRFIADRSRLLSAISHDLKTPITRMRLRAEMLEDTEQSENFIRNLDEMQAIATETLDFLRTDDANETLESIDMCELLKTIKEQAVELTQKVELKSCRVSRCSVRPHAIKRCIVNLVENAVKYAGGAEMRASEDTENVYIYVSDSGAGIPDNKLEAVFEPFIRLEASRNRNTGGTGLGLSIARNIALSHGGKLQLENRKSGGLQACLILPR